LRKVGCIQAAKVSPEWCERIGCNSFSRPLPSKEKGNLEVSLKFMIGG